MILDRRHFLKNAGAALALGSFGASILDLAFPGEARADMLSVSPALPIGTPILVWVDLAGGNDTLNTHVPHSVPGVSSHYHAARPNLAITSVTSTRPYGPPTSSNWLPPALDLDGRYGFHGSLVWLSNRWHTRGDVAVVQGVGEDVKKERSHFAASAYRAAGAFDGDRLATGWLGRYNDLLRSGAPLASTSVAGLHASLTGVATSAASVRDVTAFHWSVPTILPDAQQIQAALLGGWDPAELPASLNKVVKAASAVQGANDAMAALSQVHPTLGSGISPGNLTWQLAQVAAMISSGIECQTYVAVLGGFDTHSSQAYAHHAKLAELDAALAYFFGIVDAGPRAGDVFVLLTSEFGRLVAENAGGGTDHGRASSAILVGGGVQGGLYGQMPSLSSLDDGALVPTVDFRSVYATVLNRLGGDPGVTQAILGQDEANADFPDLGVFT